MYRITADNPHGLPYSAIAESASTAATLIARIRHQGGTNIVVNGQSLPED